MRTMSLMVALAATLFTTAAAAQPVGRNVPLEHFFRHAEFTSVTISPDARHMSVTVPQGSKTVLAVIRIADREIVGGWDAGENRHIENIYWVNERRFIYRATERVGSLDFRTLPADMFVSDIDGRRHWAIPNGNTYSIIGRVRGEPDSLWVQRSAGQAFLFKLDTSIGLTRPGTRRADPIAYATAPLDFGRFLLDHEDRLRYVVGVNNDRRAMTLRREGDNWVTVHEGSEDEATGQRSPIAFAADNRRVYFNVSDGGEPARIVLRDPESGEESVVASHDNVDDVDTIWSSDRTTLLAVAYMPDYPTYHFVEPDHPEARILRGLVAAFPNHFVQFGTMSESGRYVLFRAFSDIDPGSYYLYDTQEGTATFLMANRSWIDPELMSPMEAVRYRARDGLMINAYLTIPRGLPDQNLPMVVFVHGGPHGPRDTWGFDREVQAMASRGYAVLQINYRGSGGYGREFMASGYRRWGTTMQDDLTDGVQWAIGAGIADPDRICIFGGSYGGYAALMSPVREPDLYRCTIGYVGVYSLPLMFRDGDIPEFESGRNFLARILPEDEAEQRAQSPAYNVDRLRIPVMLVQGARDVRVPISQMRFLIDQMEDAGMAPEDVVVEDGEGHGFYNPENNVELYQRIFTFLDRHTAPRGD